jgi:hypothetical protein
MLSLAGSTEAIGGRGRPTRGIDRRRFAVGDVVKNLSDTFLEASLDSVFVADMNVLCRLHICDSYAPPTPMVKSPAYIGFEPVPYAKLTDETGSVDSRSLS